VTAPATRWIVTDLDGTLVGADLRIVERSRQALAAFRRAGGEVFLATGRNEVSAGRYHAELGLTTPAILYNGARVVDLTTGQVLYGKEIGGSFDALRKNVLDRLPPTVGAVAFAGGEPVAVHPAPVLAEYARRDGLRLLPSGPTAELGPVVKVLLVNDRPELSGLADAVHRACPELVTVSSEPTYLEVLPPGASKGAALRFLAQHRGVDLAQVAAIGDNHNDADMLVAAGLAAVPADANPGIRELADLVVGRCADGAVADLVAHLLAGDGAFSEGRVAAAPAPADGAAYARRAGPAGEETG
jgi:Cof subfamily protein (haloacid dehalogenase superfamily)